jgi:hypothetical protein
VDHHQPAGLLTVSSKLYGGTAVTSIEYAVCNFKDEHTCTIARWAGIKKAPLLWQNSVFKGQGVASESSWGLVVFFEFYHFTVVFQVF